MSTLSRRGFGAHQSGYSMIELLVAILIALFLIGGIIVVEQGVHRAYGDQSGISKLQDEERFAMSIMTDVVASAGYFPDPTSTSVVTALPATGTPLSFAAGQTLYGTAGPDTLYVRFMTASGDGIQLCDGTTNTSGANVSYTSYLYVSNNQLYCQVQPGSAAAWSSPVQLVNDVTNMQVWYGLNTSGTDNNVDTYKPAANMAAADWPSVSSVMVQLTFVNPLYGSPGQTATTDQTVAFRRVISVMGRD